MQLQNTFGNKGPAVAAIINGDKSAVFNCGFIGYQDTLFDAMGRHYFKNCYIQGEVDFIFGEAQSYFEVVVVLIIHIYNIFYYFLIYYNFFLFIVANIHILILVLGFLHVVGLCDKRNTR